MSTEKTNKSFTKRIKKTRTGKLVARVPGMNHFNAKMSRNKQLEKKRGKILDIKNKTIDGNMPHS